jgi:eukaryotic-like serine/threonine-protein kinase
MSANEFSSDFAPHDHLDLKIDADFHGFRIVGRLYSGADGEVYEAHDPDGRPCALKVPLARGLGNLRRYATFRTEWELAGKLDHEHIVTVRKTDYRFLVMELLVGRDLRSTLRKRKRLEWAETERYLLEICRALAYLHSRDIVHHDLKPENVVLDREHGVKLVDFGLAYCQDLDDPLGVIREPLGTPYYIAPEQLEGIRGNPASDMYSLGVLLYEMLTGELPFAKSTTKRGARKRLYLEPMPPRVHRPDLPCGIQELLFLLLDRDPFSRPNASNLLQAVGRGIDWNSIVCITPERSALDRWMDNFRLWKPLRYKEFLRKQPRPIEGNHLLVVIREDRATDHAIQTIRKQAKLLDATVTLVGIVPFNLPDADLAESERAIVANVDQWMETLTESDISTRFRIMEGDPEAEILHYAKTRDIDTIVIASTAQPGIRRFFGSHGLAQRLVQNAPCTVLVIKG